MSEHDWIKEFPAAITVCNPSGVIVAMNDRAAKTYEKQGGYALLGCSLLDCHPDPARGNVEILLVAQNKNVYSIEKKWRQEAHLPKPMV